MTTLSLRLPESIHRKLAEIAKSEGISINQFIASAAAEKLAALTTETYLAERASRAARTRFESALAAVPDVPPDEGDERPVCYRKPSVKKLPNKALQRTRRKPTRR
jgi:uncharacterized protein (DUF1778 family)